ncbi:hypothetical protein [Pelagibacterium sediminicola]|uniref:hypothetical protein n=1 Tax=Pelagibacterium sediminicola TaxID=2248761 RepID=UPI000E30ECF9|nr:hypothetical protein [Pelagibacterium sediminicola]
MLQSPNIGTDDIRMALKINAPGAMMEALLQAWLVRKTPEGQDAMVQLLIGELVARCQLSERG